MKTKFSSDFKLAVLGGGQLGKMLLYETRKWDVHTKVLDPSDQAPCRVACNEFVIGDLNDYDTVMNFAQDADVVTIEIEHVNVQALRDLKAAGKSVHPDPEMLAVIKNKARQKELYLKNELPTAPFKVYPNVAEAKKAVEKGEFELPCVWKSAEGGYDGKGVKMIRTVEDLDFETNAECLLEEKVDFAHEIGVIIATRADKNQSAVYPPVEMDFHPEANLVEFVISPAQLTADQYTEAQRVAKKVAQTMGSTGLLAVELFLSKEGKLFVNEVAPRPHNSGHLTIENNYTNQFEQHLRAILNLPLGSTEEKTAGVMVNLVGAEGENGPVEYKDIEKALEMPGVTPHIYGKAETRPWRKMGHITIIGPDRESAMRKAVIAKDIIRVQSR